MKYQKTTNILKIDSVCLSYNGEPVLRDVSAVIDNIVRPDAVQGQVVGFLGPSGIGKTRLSRLITGLDQPDSGTITVEGTPTYAGRVGLVDQRYTLFDYATVELTFKIAMGGKKHPRYQEYIDIFGLTKYLKMYTGSLSGGTKQRVKIVEQLLCSEHFIVMDEPFSGLDLVMKERACKLITQVANLDEVNTIIVVTHDVTEAASISDTLWLMGHEQINGEYVPGAKLVKQYDLAEMGLCWDEEIIHRADFLKFVDHVKKEFKTLKKF